MTLDENERSEVRSVSGIIPQSEATRDLRLAGSETQVSEA